MRTSPSWRSGHAIRHGGSRFRRDGGAAGSHQAGNVSGFGAAAVDAVMRPIAAAAAVVVLPNRSPDGEHNGALGTTLVENVSA